MEGAATGVLLVLLHGKCSAPIMCVIDSFDEHLVRVTWKVQCFVRAFVRLRLVLKQV